MSGCPSLARKWLPSIGAAERSERRGRSFFTVCIKNAVPADEVIREDQTCRHASRSGGDYCRADRVDASRFLRPQSGRPRASPRIRRRSHASRSSMSIRAHSAPSLTNVEMLLDPSLAAVATGQRISYVSSDPDGGPIVVTGAILTPRKQNPHAEQDVVAWAHGTEGLADHCASVPLRLVVLRPVLSPVRDHRQIARGPRVDRRGDRLRRSRVLPARIRT